jgi:type I restriction enzyme, S subunit
MKPYPEYKYSGVEWIGELPIHWTNTRIKSVVDSVINGVWGDDPQEDENDIICVRVADFDMQNLGVGKEKLTTRNIPKNQQGERLLAKDDLLVEKSGGGDNQPVGRVIKFDLDDKAVCSNFIGKISVNKPKVFPSFLLYYLSNLYNKSINTRSIKQTTGIQNLDTYSYFSERISLPPLPEQQAIADFLDRKTAQIDTLIARKQRQIELLREQRTALINQAVTKGLNPDAPMKDSGVEWLGEIPSHWRIYHFRRGIEFLTDFEANGSFASIRDNVEVDIGEPFAWYVRATDLENERFGISEGNRYCNKETYLFLKKTKLFGGELLVAKRGEIGKAYLMPKINSPATLGPNLYLIRLKEKLNSSYAYYWFTSAGNSELVLANKSTTIGALYKDDIKHCLTLFPPIDEQNAIADYIYEKIKEYRLIIDKIKLQISLLHEYRTELISAAVTGKIDLRTTE